MTKIIAAIYRAALLVCGFEWNLFMAREERGAGHADKAAEHVKRASETYDFIRASIDELREAGE